MNIQEKLATLQSDSEFVASLKAELEKLSSINATEEVVNASLTSMFLAEAQSKGISLTPAELASYKSDQEDSELAAVSGGGHMACTIGAGAAGLACGVGAIFTVGVVGAASAFVAAPIGAASELA